MTAPPAGALEACPFCGGGAEVMIGYHARTDAKVGCTDCSAEGPLFGSNDFSGGDHAAEAIAAWNRRTYSPALLAALRLREGWRPVLTMPGDGGTYLVTNQLGEVCPLLGGVIQNNVGRQDWTWGNPIIAWMPLPAPPTADDLARILENER